MTVAEFDDALDALIEKARTDGLGEETILWSLVRVVAIVDEGEQG
jgi:hypothetical protein